MDEVKGYMKFEDIAQVALDQNSLKYGLTPMFWVGICTLIDNPGDAQSRQRLDSYNALVDNAAKSQDAKQSAFWHKIKELLGSVSMASQNYTNPQAREFTERLKVLSRLVFARYNGSRYEWWGEKEHRAMQPMPADQNEYENLQLSVLNRVNQITDELKKYEMLNFFITGGAVNSTSPKSVQAALTYRANSPFATVLDLHTMSFIVPEEDTETHLKIYQDAKSKINKMLAEELKADVIDHKKIDTEVKFFKTLAYNTMQWHAISQSEYRSVLEEYDTQRLLLPDALKYMQKLSNAEHAQIAALKEQIAALNEQIAQSQAELTQRKSELSKLREDLDTAQRQNDALAQENQNLRNANATQGQLAEERKDIIKRMTEASARLGGGIFRKDVEEYKRMMAEVASQVNIKK